MDFDTSRDERDRSTVAARLAPLLPSWEKLGGPATREQILQAQGALSLLPWTTGTRLEAARLSTPLFLSVEATCQLRAALKHAGLAIPPGEWIGAVALSEPPGAGASAVSADGDSFKLASRKAHVTNGPVADWMGVFASDGGKPMLCLAARSDAGVGFGPPDALAGLEGLAVGPCSFEARLPKARCGDGTEARRAWQLEADLALAIAASGLGRRAWDAARRHAFSHVREGKPVIARQEVAFKLAEMYTQLEAGDLLCHRAAWMLETKHLEASTVVRCAKVFCCEGAERVAGSAMQILAAEGWLKGSVVERAWRDAKGLSLAGTTLELGRMAVADEVLSRY